LVINSWQGVGVDVEFDESKVDGRVVLAVRGEVDVYSAPAFRDRITELLDVDPLLVLDLTGLGFIDSTGLGVLVAGRNRSLERGGAVAFVCTQERVLKLLRITGLDAVFDIHATVDGAVAALRAAR
jgi:anti-sigma B factor antagonist